ncbi:phosphoenolpyruvate hydrolase family protein [Feifania hominis]|uniref:Phosphoenolpyruvate hydrolase family protein n=1 Tax=Feifania hominis TaxID=2763660 RepID=A0A926DDI6_9FIRM|nr:phosphoenolpyruvate hydrolase family protein [Feifania hominis]MBC8535334.1 phosphoenolpyruvate hydrolase family protein [Feifania hominis]
MGKVSREVLLHRVAKLKAENRAIIATGAGIGITARCQEVAGSDLILVDMAARMRMAGFGAMSANFAVKRANSLIAELAPEILPIVEHTPVLAGVAATEPFADIRQTIRECSECGYSGVFNSPSVGWNDSFNAKNLTRVGLGYDREIELIAVAHGENLITLARCYDAWQAGEMARAGADFIVADLGPTAGGLSGVKTTLDHDEIRKLTESIVRAARGENESVTVLCTGGPLAAPREVELLLNSIAGLDGFYGGSATDSIPMEQGIISVAQGFKQTRLYGF